MKHKLETACAFSLNDWWTLARTWFLLLAIDLGLRVLPFKRVQAFAAQVRPRDATSERDNAWNTIQRLHRFVDIAARHHLYPMTCLRQALALQCMLGQRGIATDLRIGVRKDGGALDAHAWVEHSGLIIERTPSTIVEFATIV